jgi:integration host factor subunit alpha
MTKADIARAVQEKASLTMKEATDAVELVIATLKETLAEGETVKFSGFGTFLVMNLKNRIYSLVSEVVLSQQKPLVQRLGHWLTT